MTKKLILITAVAVMLVGATSAYGYEEAWEGWFNSGKLTFTDSSEFEYVEGEGILRDTTAGSVDSFLVTTVTPGTFTCTAKGWTIKLWPGASGYKYTGQSGQKEVYDGAWLGKARLIIPQPPPEPPDIVDFTSVGGTWDTSVGDDCFNYPDPPARPTYSAHWIALRSTPLGITGYGGSAGELIDYSP